MQPIQPLVDYTEIFRTNPSIAVVGFSPKTNRPSHMVGKYLMDAGFKVFPVNPGVTQILGHSCYPDLASIPEKVDLVDIFRRSDEVLPIVAAAIAIKAKIIWMQEGIVNLEAAKLAEDAGIKVIMDRCIKIDHMNSAR